MKVNRINATVVTAAATVAVGIMGAPIATADDVTTTTIGQQAKLTNGNVVQGWTISGLKPSSDAISYRPRGTLWEATATNEAIRGSVQPIVSNLNARTASGDDYRVLFGVATPQGVNPSPLAQGEKTTGKVYFDVTGANPDSVVYNAAGDDLVVWKPAPAVQSAPGWAPPSTGNVQRAPAPSAGSRTPPAATPQAPAAGSQGTPMAPGAPAAPPAPAAGSQGTPMAPGAPAAPQAPAAGSQGTPMAPGAPAAPQAPAAGSQGTPMAPGAPAAPPAPAAGSHGTPMAPGAPAAPPAPAAGSHGTPMAPGAPAAPPADGEEIILLPGGAQGTPAS
jgi:hypothetical protein